MADPISRHMYRAARDRLAQQAIREIGLIVGIASRMRSTLEGGQTKMLGEERRLHDYVGDLGRHLARLDAYVELEYLLDDDPARETPREGGDAALRGVVARHFKDEGVSDG